MSAAAPEEENLMLLDADAWDDTELIKIFDQQVAAYSNDKNLQAKTKLINTEKNQEEEEEGEEFYYNKPSKTTKPTAKPATKKKSPAIFTPPIPETIQQDENLTNLLMSWYYAGYYAAKAELSLKK